MTTSKPTDSREQNDVSKQTKIEDAISQLKQSYNNSTAVVGWYYHPCEVRGPFNRWLTVSDVPETHKKDVASQSDDAKYAADAMNFAPKIIADYEQLRAENNKLREQVKDYEQALEFYADCKELKLKYAPKEVMQNTVIFGQCENYIESNGDLAKKVLKKWRGV